MQQLRLRIKRGKKLSLNKYEFYAYLKAKREDESIGHFGFVIYFNKIKQLNKLAFEGIKAFFFLCSLVKETYTHIHKNPSKNKQGLLYCLEKP
ncbi:MAG: hypothetical protein K2W92_07800 [Alphaproteobacteria bacterium]|nr:hypothetical protein [Alphaproteobacteria bacterium]